MPDLLDTIADGQEAVDAATRERAEEYGARVRELLTSRRGRNPWILRRMLAERAVRTAEGHDDQETASANAQGIAGVATLTFAEALSVPRRERDGLWYSGVSLMLTWCQRQAFAEIVAPTVAGLSLQYGDRVNREERDTDARTLVRLARESEPDDSGKRKPMLDKTRRQAARERRANSDV